MTAYFVMIREQTTDKAALAEYGPRLLLLRRVILKAARRLRGARST